MSSSSCHSGYYKYVHWGHSGFYKYVHWSQLGPRQPFKRSSLMANPTIANLFIWMSSGSLVFEIKKHVFSNWTRCHVNLHILCSSCTSRIITKFNRDQHVLWVIAIEDKLISTEKRESNFNLPLYDISQINFASLEFRNVHITPM